MDQKYDEPVFTEDIKPSDMILATFVTKDGAKYEFRIDGRGTSVHKQKQGDHVTAYGLVERGIKRHFRNILITKVEDLDLLRQQRLELFEYIIKLKAINGDFADKIEKLMEIVQKQYNLNRYSKDKLVALESKLGLLDLGLSDATADENTPLMLHEEIIETCRDLMAHTYITNCNAMCEQIGQITRGVLTHYNHIPDTSYPKYHGSPAGEEAGALKYLDDRAVLLENLSDGKMKLPYKDIAKKINDLFFYPYIKDEEIKEMAKKLGKKPKCVRSNDYKRLCEITARHLFIVFAVYPELELYKEGLLKEFILIFITAQGWSSAISSKNFKKDIDDSLQEIEADLEDQKRFEGYSSEENVEHITMLSLRQR
jgi:hypothetical protein